MTAKDKSAPDRIAIRWEAGKAVTSGPLMDNPAYTQYVRADRASAPRPVVDETRLFEILDEHLGVEYDCQYPFIDGKDKAVAAILAALQPSETADPVAEAARIIMHHLTLRDMRKIYDAAEAAMYPDGWTVSDQLRFDAGLIAALRALIREQETSND